MDLLERIRKISANVELQRDLMKTEEATKQVSIRPFIEALDYDTSDLSEVTPEYIADARSSGSERVDYAIKRDGKTIILVESKSANTILTENHWRQLHNYFNAEEVRFGILTNGIEYRFYSDLKKSNIMDKEPFLVIDMLNLNDRRVTELERFTKSNFDADVILSNAQKLAIYQFLLDELNQPSAEFVKHFARQLHPDPLSYSQMQRYTHLVNQACRELLDDRYFVSRDSHTASEPDVAVEEPTTLRDRIQRLEPPRTPTPIRNQRPPEQDLTRSHNFESRKLYKRGTKKAKGFFKSMNGGLAIYDAADEKRFWVEDARILDSTCYPEMNIEISNRHRKTNPDPPPNEILVNQIPKNLRFEFEYEFRGSGRYVVTRII